MALIHFSLQLDGVLHSAHVAIITQRNNQFSIEYLKENYTIWSGMLDKNSLSIYNKGYKSIIYNHYNQIHA